MIVSSTTTSTQLAATGAAVALPTAALCHVFFSRLQHALPLAVLANLSPGLRLTTPPLLLALLSSVHLGRFAVVLTHHAPPARSTPLTTITAATTELLGLFFPAEIAAQPPPRRSIRVLRTAAEHLLTGLFKWTSAAALLALLRQLTFHPHILPAFARRLPPPPEPLIGGLFLGLALASSFPADLLAASLLTATGGVVHLQPPHHRPLLATSPTDFWGRRYNRPAHAWLRANIYQPMLQLQLELGPSGPTPALRLAAAATVFLASAAFHVAPARAAGHGLCPSLSLVLFFTLHGAAVAADLSPAGRRIRQEWSPMKRWLCFQAFLLATLPLYARPFVDRLPTLLRTWPLPTLSLENTP